MPLTAADLEAAFCETVRAQQNGEPFDWHRLARIINARLADQRARALGEQPLVRWPS